ncbi:unnamed protein product [Auanema sp. JU1783]|nr:unnamed protein product [Auanema sp. JU1783]
MAVLDFVAGCFGGAAGVLAGHPLDTVKVRLQTQPQGSAAIYRGTWHCFRTIIHKEGFQGLFKGLSSPLASLAAINAIVFGVHRSITRKFENPDSLRAHFFAGCAAGLAQTVIAAPSERLKLLIQIQADSAHTVYRSPYDAARSLIQQHGLRTINRGFFMTLIRDSPAFGVYFASYEWMTKRMSKDGKMSSLSAPQLLFAGGAAGMISWLVTYPTDVIKTRFQADTSYKSYMDCISHTYRDRGLRGFYVGLGSTLIRAFPSNAATFFTVEWTYRLMLDFNVVGVKTETERQILREHHSHRITDLWNLNHMHFLPEAGSTSIDPMIHGCRFL